MDELILTLLKENSRVIIPDFGALLVKQKNPFTVIFNEFLQYNDGALVGAVVTKFNIDRDTATQKVKDLAIDYKEKLNRGEKIALKEIGFLTKSSTGKISLSSTDETVQQASKPVTNHSIKEDSSKTVEFELEPETKVETKQQLVESIEKKAEKPVEKPVEKQLEKPIEKPKEKPVESTIISSQTTEKKPVYSTTSATKPITTSNTIVSDKPKSTSNDTQKNINSNLKPPATQDAYTFREQKKSKNIFLWVLIIVLINGAIIGYFVYGDQIKEFYLKKKATQNAAVVIPEDTADVFQSESTTNETVAEDEVVSEGENVTESTPEEAIPEEKPVQAKPEKPVYSGANYYVVAGVFREEANADKLVRELRNKGYNAKKFGKIGSLNAVCYDVFPSKEEAERYKLKIRNEIDNQAWIKVVE